MVQARMLLIAGALSLYGAAQADVTVEMRAVDANGVGQAIGQVLIEESPEDGLVFTPSLEGLPPGLHGFHVHENPSCEPAEKGGKMAAAEAAGGHYDPEDSGHHEAPWGEGHLGDLPALFVDDDGGATHPVMAPRLELDDIEGRSLMVHAGGDNYSDRPAPLGGGGDRIACGVIR